MDLKFMFCVVEIKKQSTWTYIITKTKTILKIFICILFDTFLH